MLLEEIRGTVHVTREDILYAKIHSGIDVQHSRIEHVWYIFTGVTAIAFKIFPK